MDLARLRRRAAAALWRVGNPLVRPLAGLAPWWLLLETTGRRTGALRRTPLALGPRDADGLWLIAVHGRRAGWVLNAEAQPSVRVRHRGRWRTATASVRPFDEAVVRRANRYARSGPALLGDDPLLVRVDWSGR